MFRSMRVLKYRLPSHLRSYTCPTAAYHYMAFKRLAKRNDQVVGVVEISPAMVDGFLREIIKAQEEGFQIVPISAVADRF